MRQIIYSRIIHDYLQRINSALEDGYVLAHGTQNKQFYCANLRHRSNGNRIYLFADFTKMTLVQKTNNIVTYQQKYE